MTIEDRIKIAKEYQEREDWVLGKREYEATPYTPKKEYAESGDELPLSNGKPTKRSNARTGKRMAPKG